MNAGQAAETSARSSVSTGMPLSDPLRIITRQLEIEQCVHQVDLITATPANGRVRCSCAACACSSQLVYREDLGDFPDQVRSMKAPCVPASSIDGRNLATGRPTLVT